MQKHRICGVEPGSIAQELGIEAGDYLISLNDRPVCDVLDYRFRTCADRLRVQFVSESGQMLTADIEKQADEGLGLEFEMPLMDQKRGCANRCIFCFVDQLPPGVRQTLRFKDDDYRLSFLQGNFVTLTNVSSKELERIVQQRLSPIYISVHTTDGALRADMLHNANAANINEQLQTLVRGRISFYAQIVVCPGVNDGETLSSTFETLSTYRPFARGVAVVPVGLTKYRDGLPSLQPVTKADAVDVIERTQAFVKTQQDEFIHLADEFYLIAERPLPGAERYGAYEQIEDGVGMMRHFIDGFLEALDETPDTKPQSPQPLSVATGEAAYPFIRDLCERAQQKTGIPIAVYPIRNTFFGGGVTVTGLLTGRCIISGLKGKPLGNRLLLSSCMTKADKAVFLDDMPVAELSDLLNTDVSIIENDGASFFRALYMERE